MKNSKILFASVLAFGMSVTSGLAATLNIVGGQLMGASDVEVGGALFDVSFMDGTCVGLFSGCDEVSDFAFSTESDAIAAAEALLDQIMQDGPLGMFDNQPDLVNGIDDVNVGRIYTPYGFGLTGQLLLARTVNTVIETSDQAELVTSFNPLSDTFNSSQIAYSLWSPSAVVVVDPGPVAPVPLPAGGVLLLSGLLGIAGLRRRQRSRG